VISRLDRSWPDQMATDERRLSWEFLDFLRVTAVNKVAGLTREQAAATPLATSPVLSILGIVRHLTSVERWWISLVGGGADLPDFWADPDRDIDFRLSNADTPESVVAGYRAEWELSARALSGKGPDDLATRPVRGEDRTVRWILAHVTQETARHVGHLHIQRELADRERGE
jgi:hypothetical protein